MSSSSPSGGAPNRPVRKPTRAQLRAMEARNMSLQRPDGAVAAPEAPPRRAKSTTAGSRLRLGGRSITLTREQEYAYIERDLRRLYLIAGTLLILMLALLYLIER